ncbi:MAG: SNF2-related protein [Oscillospiraceae bacterium]|nr:SNF2-related protein [Oscillospiraceae bacterium]
MYQVGDFFEMYGADAELAADVLGIVAFESRDGLPEPVKTTGIPKHMFGEYTIKLHEAGHRLAVSTLTADGSRNVFIYEATPPIEPVQYNIGDRLMYNGKLHEITKIDNYVQLQNRDMTNPARYPIFDNVALLRDDFERMLSDGELAIMPPDVIPEPEKPLDFDSISQMVLDRVMADTNYAETLANATSRASLRNPCTWALDQSIRDHEQDEPQIYRAYFWDDDFNDRLFDFVLRQSWEQRKQHVAEVNSQTEAAKPTAEKLLSQYGTDYYLFHFPENNEVPAELSIDTLSLITEKAEHYVICADALNLSEDDLTKYNIEFRKMPRDFELLPETVREKINEINPGYMEDLICSELVLRGYDIYGDLIKDGVMDYRTHGGRGNVQDIADFIENEYLAEETEQTPELDEIESTVVPSTERDISEPSTIVPSPVFFVDWDSAQYDFDLNLYNDRDIIGYNKDGVEYRAGRSGSLNYITNTGAFWGSNTVPGNIYEQINTYKNGELTNEQVRENYLNVLETFRNYRIADLERTNTDLIDVLNNGLISQAEKDTVSSMFKNSAVNHDITVLLSESYNGTVETMMLTGGEIADYSATSESLTIEIIDKFDTKLSFTWVDIAPVVRVLAQQWEAKPIELEPPESVELPTQMSITQTKPERKTNATPTNYRITDDRLGEGGAKTKFRNNINAIITLHDIEFEKRAATSEEQEILSKYVGWGGLPQAFDPDNAQWTNEYLELNSALSPNEWESARASTLNAHYTSPTVIRAIYDTVERLGFKSGNILEPSCGVGNFFGLLPDDMKSSKLYGIELDSVTGKIAQLLYPNADIKITGYEKSDMPDNFMDLAIGNIPFGGYGVADKRYDKYNLYIHDYFFAKTLDKVRPGGIIAFITSKGTLDKQNPEVRKYIAQRAELLGAVRLPNNAFLRNAGTEVTSDIIFLQKRDRPIDIEPDWVHLGLTDDGVPINRYFIDNPEMLLGTMAFDDRMYGKEKDTTCNPIEGADLAEQLKTALSYIRGQYTIEELDDLDGVDDHAIPADSNVKNFSYADVDGMVYFRENSLMYPVDLPAATLERIRGMIGLRKCVHRLIDLQLDEHSEPEIRIQQTELNDLYDSFITQFGLINSQANNRAFNADSAYYLLCSLEIIDEDGNLERKADMFTKRTIKQKTVITHVDTASEALAVSLGEKACVDMAYMSELTGFTPEKLYQDLEGIIFYNFGNPDRSLPPFNPETMKLHEKFLLVTSDEYLSGNVRDKLYVIKKFNEGVGDIWQGVDITVNVKALEAAQPKDLTASEIAVRLGSTWIDPEYIQQFMYELLNTSYYNKKVYQVKYHSYTGEWQVTGKGKAQYSDIHATVTYGTSRMNAYQIIDDTLNLRDARVYDYNKDADGNDKRVLNKKETTLAQQKQEQIKQAFRDWIWKDPERRQALVRKYNDMFNSIKPREYDGSHIVFSGISPEITLRPHQLNAIAHILYGGNTLLAHEVGAGKTFEMVGAAMESKRLGLCQKSLFAVPNHLTEQWAGEFLRLYPSANILVATKKDFEMRNRKKFCAKIATGDYDAVIIGHSQMEKIPMSQERQERLLNEQIWEIEEGIRELKASNGERFSIKQLEKTKKSLEVRLAKLLESKKRDDVVTFEQLGVDRLFIDEAHAFKDL